MSSEWQGFYSTAQVSRLARIPLSTIYEWRRRGIIRPSLELVEGDLVADEGYSYSDLTLIRIIKALRDQRLDFDSAARALRHMYERLGPPDRGWVNETVYVVGNRIYVDRPDEWEITDATELGQRVMETLFGDLFEELREIDEEASIFISLKYLAKSCACFNPVSFSSISILPLNTSLTFHSVSPCLTKIICV
ncbi:unnamed protein product, partial [marine sediment metagenome]